MAKKDAVSKRLALEIALAKRIKKAREETPKKVPEETQERPAGLGSLFALLGESQPDGRFADGTLAEIFITNGKAGSDADTAARDSAVVASIALQYGVPLEVIRHALMRNRDGSACGPLGAALDLLHEREAER